MAALSSMCLFSCIAQTKEGKGCFPGFVSGGLRWRMSFGQAVIAPVAKPLACCRRSISCLMAAAAVASDVPPVSETKLAFLKAYRKPIPSIYNNVLQELLVLQHLMRYNQTYQYDAIFALGFVTVYDQLMDGYPSTEDREAIFKGYISALREDPDQYRKDSKMLEEWAATQNSESILSFSSRDGEVEETLKDIAVRAGGNGNFHYSRFIAVGLFRLLELAKASDPAVLEQLSKALNISKRSVDRDLDVYRNLLSKLAQAKELLNEYIDREKKKQAERDVVKIDGAAVAKLEA